MYYSSSAFPGTGRGAPPAASALALLLAALAIDLALIFYCLDDLNRHQLVAGGDKRFWVAVIILGGPLGQIFYWLYGRGPY
jgi:hypothetical protein